MSRKDYVAMARAFRAVYDSYDEALETRQREGVVAAVEAAASVFRADNPLFDRDRFLTAALGDR